MALTAATAGADYFFYTMVVLSTFYPKLKAVFKSLSFLRRGSAQKNVIGIVSSP